MTTVVFLASAILVSLVVRDLYLATPAKGFNLRHALWFVWVTANVLVGIGGMSVIFYVLFDTPPPEFNMSIMVIGTMLRVACIQFSVYTEIK